MVRHLSKRKYDMNVGEVCEKIKFIIEKIQDWLDGSPNNLSLSCDEILREKIKTSLTKYALYDEVNARDLCFNGFGLLDVEFIGKENEISNFKIVIGKLVYDYIYSYYLGYTRTKTAVEKYGENMYIVRVYYAFSKKTLKQFELYFNETSEYKKREILEQETVKDETLEQEMKKWNV